MSDITLTDGTAVNIDLLKVTITEYRQFCKGTMLDEADDLLLARCCGLDVEYIRNLPAPDFERLVAAIFDKFRVGADPN